MSNEEPRSAQARLKAQVVSSPFGGKQTPENNDRQDEENLPDEDLGLHAFVPVLTPAPLDGVGGDFGQLQGRK